MMPGFGGNKLPITIVMRREGVKWYNVKFREKGLTEADPPRVGNVYVSKDLLDGDEEELEITIRRVK